MFKTDLNFFFLACFKCLTELRDKIFCTSDDMILGDHSEKPDELNESTAKVCTNFNSGAPRAPKARARGAP